MTNEELIQKIQSGENVQENMGLLYEQNRGFIYKCALPFTRRIDIDDLMQEAYFGLERAAKHFDSTKECSFLTYATYKIKSHLQRYYYNYGKIKRIPAHLIEKLSKYHKYISDYKSDNGENPSDELIQKHLQMNERQYKSLLKASAESNTIGFDDVIPGTDLTVSEGIADETNMEDAIIQKIAEEQVNSEIWKCIEELDPKLKDVLQLRYKDGLTQSDIAEKYDVSPERIRQYEHKAYSLLKKKEAIQNAAEFYGVNCSITYHGGCGFFKQYGSSTEFLALKSIELEERKSKVDKMIDNMVWEV